MVRRIFGTVIVTSNAEKRKILREVFVGTLIQGSSIDPLRDSLVSLVDVLSPEHVGVLRAVREIIWKKTGEYPDVNDPTYAHSYGAEVKDVALESGVGSQTLAVLTDLVAHGLAEVLSYTSEPRSYRPSALGEEFLALLLYA